MGGSGARGHQRLEELCGGFINDGGGTLYLDYPGTTDTIAHDINNLGHVVGNFAGESDYLHHGNVIAGTPKVFAQMVNLLSPFAK